MTSFALRPYKALFFDIDNTLLSFRPSSQVALKKTFEHYELPYKSEYFEVFYWIGEILWSQQRQELMTIDQIQELIFPRLLLALGLQADGRAMNITFHKLLHQEAVLEPNALETIQALSQHHRLYTASNGFLSMQRSRLKVAGLLPYFTDLFVSDDIGAEKPSPAFFEEALRRGDLRPEEVLFIGDSLSADMIGAERIGMDRCWYNPNERPRPVTPSLTFEINSLSELPHS